MVELKEFPGLSYDEETFDSFFAHDRYKEHWMTPEEAASGPDFEGGTPRRDVCEAMACDLAIRSAKRAGKDASKAVERRARLVERFSRDALCYLCAAYQPLEAEDPFTEREYYLRLLEIADGGTVSAVHVRFEPHSGEASQSLHFYLKGRDVGVVRAGHVEEGVRKTVTLGLSGSDMARVSDLVRRCDFLSWRPQYGNPWTGRSNGEAWSVSVSYAVGLSDDGNATKCRVRRSCGFDDAKAPLWHALGTLVHALYRMRGGIVRLPGLCRSEVGVIWPVALGDWELMRFHGAFECSLPSVPYVARKGDYAVFPLVARDAYGDGHPDLSLLDRLSALRDDFGQTPLGFSGSCLGAATGFALAKGRTVVFVYLGANPDDARRILGEIPERKTPFEEGDLSTGEAMRKVAALLSGLALSNRQEKSVPYARVGQQPGIVPTGEAYLTRDGRLDYVWFGCNSDEFFPCFRQDRNGGII